MGKIHIRRPAFIRRAVGGARLLQGKELSLRDEEVIKAADEHNLALVFTGVRHFRH